MNKFLDKLEYFIIVILLPVMLITFCVLILL